LLVATSTRNCNYLKLFLTPPFRSPDLTLLASVTWGLGIFSWRVIEILVGSIWFIGFPVNIVNGLWYLMDHNGSMITLHIFGSITKYNPYDHGCLAATAQLNMGSTPQKCRSADLNTPEIVVSRCCTPFKTCVDRYTCVYTVDTTSSTTTTTTSTTTTTYYIQHTAIIITIFITITTTIITIITTITITKIITFSNNI
jgi:hypothetical protein